MVKVIRTEEISGVKFNIVNELPTQVFQKLKEVVESYFEGGESSPLDKVGEFLRFIAGGACGSVFELGEEYVLKVNLGSWDELKDGSVLFDLQGVPHIPTLYCYSEDDTFIVSQKVKGQTFREFTTRPNFVPKGFPEREEYKKQVVEFLEACTERGWVAHDCHMSNVMIDENGEFWVVDVGLFCRVGEKTCGTYYCSHFLTCDDVDPYKEKIEMLSHWENVKYTIEELRKKQPELKANEFFVSDNKAVFA